MTHRVTLRMGAANTLLLGIDHGNSTVSGYGVYFPRFDDFLWTEPHESHWNEDDAVELTFEDDGSVHITNAGKAACIPIIERETVRERTARAEELLNQEWGEVWETLAPAPPLVPRKDDEDSTT